MTEKYALAWGGGKDSCLCLYKMLKEGKDIRYLFTRLCKTGSKFGFLGISEEMIKTQSKLLGIPLMTVKGDYVEREFMERKGAGKLKKKGINGIIFGKIQPELCEKTRNEFLDYGIKALFPFEGIKQPLLIRECLDLGFKLIITTVGSEEILDWLGREIDNEFIEEFYGKSPNFPKTQQSNRVLSGLQSFVFDCPLFEKKIKITGFEESIISFGNTPLSVKALESVEFKLLGK